MCYGRCTGTGEWQDSCSVNVLFSKRGKSGIQKVYSRRTSTVGKVSKRALKSRRFHEEGSPQLKLRGL